MATYSSPTGTHLDPTAYLQRATNKPTYVICTKSLMANMAILFLRRRLCGPMTNTIRAKKLVRRTLQDAVGILVRSLADQICDAILVKVDDTPKGQQAERKQDADDICGQPWRMI